MIMKIKYLLLFSLLMFEYSLAAVPNDWQKRFLSPSVADRPWAVWSWDNKDVTFQEVRDKLDTMHKVGLEGVVFWLSMLIGNPDIGGCLILQ